MKQVGKMVLDQHITNHFAENEQVAFSPANLVPGAACRSCPRVYVHLRGGSECGEGRVRRGSPSAGCMLVAGQPSCRRHPATILECLLAACLQCHRAGSDWARVCRHCAQQRQAAAVAPACLPRCAALQAGASTGRTSL